MAAGADLACVSATGVYFVAPGDQVFVRQLWSIQRADARPTPLIARLIEVLSD